jgi:ethanolamine transporter EutH
MLVVFLTRLLAGTLEQAGVSTLQPLLLLQLLFLVAFFCICVVAGPWRDTDAILVGFTIGCVLGALLKLGEVGGGLPGSGL